ncbi:HAD family hydrolase [Streptoalloteichus hindustanus]|nr:HAD family phosphatase [Streptoalloteichus hindustanus]
MSTRPAGTSHVPVMFDMDGTLVDLAAPPSELAELRAEVRALAERERVALDHFGIFPMYRALCVAGRGADEARELLDQYEVRWARTSARPLVSPYRLAGFLSSSSAALVTSNGRACVAALRDGGLLPDGFLVEVTRDDCAHLKPHPEPVRRAVAVLDEAAPSGALTADDLVLFVGDSDADRLAVDAYRRTRDAPLLRFLRVSPADGSPDPVDVATGSVG